jgi:thiol:disulfide interchange protein
MTFPPPSRSRRRFVAGALLLAVPLAAPAQLLPKTFDPARDAAKDLETAQSIARSSGRRVLVNVGGEWCPWCHVMDRFFAGNEEMRRLRDRNYVWVKVNYSKDSPNQKVLLRWPKVAGYPHLFVLDADGRLLHSQDTSALEAGKDYDAVAFRDFLVKWAPDAPR